MASNIPGRKVVVNPQVFRSFLHGFILRDIQTIACLLVWLPVVSHVAVVVRASSVNQDAPMLLRSLLQNCSGGPSKPQEGGCEYDGQCLIGPLHCVCTVPVHEVSD